jgi:hypothetical protein
MHLQPSQPLPREGVLPHVVALVQQQCVVLRHRNVVALSHARNAAPTGNADAH